MDLKDSFAARLRFTFSHLLPSSPLCFDLEQGFQSFPLILPLENVTRVAKRLSTIFLGAPATCECAPGGEELQLPHSCPKVQSPPCSFLQTKYHRSNLTPSSLHHRPLTMIKGLRYHPRSTFLFVLQSSSIL